MSPKERRFDTTMTLKASREDVWDAISSEEGLRSWFCPDAELTPKVGGAVVWKWGEMYTWPQTIEVWKPGEHLRTRYDSPVDDGRGGRMPLFIDFVLEGAGGTTTLRVVHSGFGPEAEFDQEYDGIRKGWPVELRSLRLYVERHLGQARRVAWARRVIQTSPDEAWKLLTGADGFACGVGVGELAEGDAFDITTADGERFVGQALACHPRELTGVVSNRGDGFLRLAVENCGGEYQAWLWLATYDEDARKSAATQRHFEQMLDRLYGPVPAAKSR